MALVYKFSGKLFKFKASGKYLLQAFDVQLQEAIRRAANSFLIETEKRVPVLTGQAKGTLKADVILPGNIVKPYEMYFSHRVTINPREYRRNKNEFTGADRAKYVVYKRRTSYRFSWESDLRDRSGFDYFEQDDNFSVPRVKSSPWGAAEAGMRAFNTRLQEELAKLEIVESYKSDLIRFGGTGQFNKLTETVKV